MNNPDKKLNEIKELMQRLRNAVDKLNLIVMDILTTEFKRGQIPYDYYASRMKKLLKPYLPYLKNKKL